MKTSIVETAFIGQKEARLRFKINTGSIAILLSLTLKFDNVRTEMPRVIFHPLVQTVAATSPSPPERSPTDIKVQHFIITLETNGGKKRFMPLLYLEYID